MNSVVLLDSGVLGLVSRPRRNEAEASWLQMLQASEIAVLVPDIADYEVRRELLRAGHLNGLRSLDRLIQRLGTVSISTSTLREAAELWALSRRRGRVTAADAALDGDVILAVQARQVEREGNAVIVATTNLRHLEWFVDARLWHDVDQSSFDR